MPISPNILYADQLNRGLQLFLTVVAFQRQMMNNFNVMMIMVRSVLVMMLSVGIAYGEPYKNLKPGDTFRICPSCPVMVVIPAGSFKMGSNEFDDAEKPIHKVTIKKTFALSRTVITEGQWEAIMGSRTVGGNEIESTWDDNSPLMQASFMDAIDFITKISKLTGVSFRLPSEAEWEYVCRAGNIQKYCSSDQPVDDNESYKQVAAKQPNVFGLYDMGTDGEWVQDAWHRNYKGAPDDGSVWMGDFSLVVSRGSTAVGRVGLNPNDNVDHGFRIFMMMP